MSLSISIKRNDKASLMHFGAQDTESKAMHEKISLFGTLIIDKKEEKPEEQKKKKKLDFTWEGAD